MLTVENFTEQDINMSLDGWSFSVDRNTTFDSWIDYNKRIDIISETDYLSGTTQRIEVYITHHGTFTALVSSQPPENVIELNSPALYLEIWRYYPMLEVNLWFISGLALSLFGIVIFWKKWPEKAITKSASVKTKLVILGTLMGTAVAAVIIAPIAAVSALMAVFIMALSVALISPGVLIIGWRLKKRRLKLIGLLGIILPIITIILLIALTRG